MPAISDMRARLVDFSERFWAKVDRRALNECWPWLGGLRGGGYGQFYIGKRTSAPAHRVAYQLVKGEVPPDLVMDHLCRNRSCCNPDHLEPVTNRENVLRGISPAARNAAKTHCRLGHPLSGDNVKSWGNRDLRVCKACMAIKRPKKPWGYRPFVCKNGHAFTPQNTYVRKDGARTCITCQTQRTNAFRARKREARAMLATIAKPDSLPTRDRV